MTEAYHEWFTVYRRRRLLSKAAEGVPCRAFSVTLNGRKLGQVRTKASENFVAFFFFPETDLFRVPSFSFDWMKKINPFPASASTSAPARVSPFSHLKFVPRENWDKFPIESFQWMCLFHLLKLSPVSVWVKFGPLRLLLEWIMDQ